MAGVVGEASKQISALDRAVKGTADRLSEYDGRLAAQKANQEVAEIMRDVQRAQRFSESTAGANESRFNMEQKLADITDRFIPFIMKIADQLFSVVTDLLELGEPAVPIILAHLEVIAFAVKAIYTVSGGGLISGLAAIAKEIKKAGEKDSGTSNTDPLWEQFAGMRRSLAAGEAPAGMPAAGAQPAIVLP
jgi:Mg2+ and Co2+ transporter CorA